VTLKLCLALAGLVETNKIGEEIQDSIHNVQERSLVQNLKNILA
jgi:hypothetical protein